MRTCLNCFFHAHAITENKAGAALGTEIRCARTVNSYNTGTAEGSCEAWTGGPVSDYGWPCPICGVVTGFVQQYYADPTNEKFKISVKE
jgi:hypothetical protein